MAIMQEGKTQNSRIKSILYLFRPNRTFMVAMITGTGAFAAGASVEVALWMTLGGWLLAVGGFSLDFYADRELDLKGPRARIRKNPLADGSIPPRSGLVFSLISLILSLIVIALFSIWSLVAWGVVIAIILGLALHWFETPIGRAITLGGLQALYLLMGASSGKISLGVILIACMFFFAMFGGRGMIDIRDFSQDEVTPVKTWPKRYGIKRTAQISGFCLIFAYLFSFLAYLTGEFNIFYLYLDMIFIVSGLIFTFFFFYRPTPKLAEYFTMVYMMGQGTIICLGVILGSF
ncbi:MAG: UbiA prenyltransferase family protein [Candidatus Hermodarchaeota archaeon]